MESKALKAPSCSNCATCSQGIFSVFKGAELSRLSEKKVFQLYKKGQYIFKEKAEPKGLFCIHDGNVKITKESEDGKEQIVRLAKAGNFIGYRALLCNDIYQASAVALEDTYVCFYNKEIYFELLYSNPAIAAQTIKVLTRDLRFAENMMLNMAQKHVKGRIAEILLMLEEFYGVYEKDGTINATLKREDIGHLVGTTTETSIRVISELVKDHLIELKGKRIMLINKEKILELSNRKN
ncbi:MAG: Crp/Fnr family transcriptional regulator [Sphingobacteriaceae bacterium]|nr:Crp/Fnr family transcriptional regulator [Sphingobacteriaceae bacterium]